MFPNRSSVVQYVILLSQYYYTAKTEALYTSIDGLTVQRTDNWPNSNKLGDFQWTVYKLMEPEACKLESSLW